MTEHAVVIAGGGPAGMMLAAELGQAGVDVAVVERRPDHVLAGSRAGGFHSRTIEVLDQRGVADRFLAEGQVVQAATFGTTVLDMSDFPARHPYLVGCDGGRSLIRRAAGIEFPGRDPTRSNLIAEVELTEEPSPGVRHDAAGVHGLHRMEDGKTFRVVTTEQQLGPGSEPTLRELSAALVAVYDTDFGVHDPTWISRFTDMTRQAAAYRAGRVLLAGDAAHVHYPAGGQGLSLGVQDAVNLGWKLAQVVHGTSPESLLDTYHDERHPVAARALRYTMARPDRAPAPRRPGQGPGRGAVRTRDHGRASPAARRARLRARHPLRPRRGTSPARTPHARPGPRDRPRPAPGLRAAARCQAGAGRPRRTRRLRHRSMGRPRPGCRRDLRGRVGAADARRVDAPTTVLVRPDGYVAWVGDGTGDGVTDALTTWFGPPAAA